MVFGAGRLDVWLPMVSYANLDVVTGGGVVLGVVVGSGVGVGVAARVFSIIKEAAKVRLIISAVKSMLFFNSTLCVFMFLLHPPSDLKRERLH